MQNLTFEQALISDDSASVSCLFLLIYTFDYIRFKVFLLKASLKITIHCLKHFSAKKFRLKKFLIKYKKNSNIYY